jgi:UrcA family protein
MTKYFKARALVPGLAAAVLLATAGASARAAPAELSTSVRVNFADLDINDPAGADALLKRIGRAAVTVCGGEPGTPLLEAEVTDYQQCREDAIRHAVRRLNAPLVTAVANGVVKPSVSSTTSH